MVTAGWWLPLYTVFISCFYFLFRYYIFVLFNGDYILFFPFSVRNLNLVHKYGPVHKDIIHAYSKQLQLISIYGKVNHF